MRSRDGFYRSAFALAVPVALQSMLQASFSAVDQIMIGRLGSVSVAGVGLAGKFSSIHGVLTASVGTVAAVMLAQYLGQGNKPALRRSFRVNLGIALGVAAVFALVCLALPRRIMTLYSTDAPTVEIAAEYLSLLAGSFVPAAASTLLSALLRCMEKPLLPLYAGIASALVNTALNALLIFGGPGVPAMGARGAALATLIAQWVNLLILLALWRLMLCGLAASAVLSGLILCIAPLYVRIFRVEPEVRQMTRRILAVYAAVAPVKVQNMILGGGVIRSGGRTSYILWVDLIGTWCFGVPLACISAFVWKLPVHWVYGLLSLEECVRLAISLGIFRSRRWMRRLEA